MDGYQFEEQCAIILKRKHFSKIEVTKSSGDQGVDIIAYKHRKKYGIQCKYYTYPVGNKAVQEAYAGANFYDCDKVIVMTNTTFTRSAIELAEKLDKIPDILKDDGYPDVQAFMKTYRKAEAIVTQYNQDLAEWEQAVKNGQKPAEKQHRPPERQSVRNRLRQLQEEGKQNSQPKQRKKSQDRDR